MFLAVRTTASVHYTKPLAQGGWSSSFIWGRDHNTASKRDLNSYLVESVLPIRGANYVTGRFELVDKDELVPDLVVTSTWPPGVRPNSGAKLEV